MAYSDNIRIIIYTLIVMTLKTLIKHSPERVQIVFIL